jgi:hypothetical protein
VASSQVDHDEAVGKTPGAFAIAIAYVHSDGMKLMFGAFEKLATISSFNVYHVSDSGNGVTRIMDLHASAKVFENLIIRKVPRSKEFMEFWP